MRMADAMVCEVCGKNPLVRELSHFLRSLIFGGSMKSASPSASGGARAGESP